MDNSIQQIINNLSDEITKLKYRNETNVTMRIDTIIEFLEQLKTDIIGEQQDQKFDLHRTATNCTITILDENEDPITDGSNKLSYGEVIKISVVASAGYENPTLSVNGLPFTSGDTMVVKADLSIEGTATAEAPSLVPFAVGDTLSNGDKIHFDTSKASEFATYLGGLTDKNDVLLSLDSGDQSVDHALPLLSVMDLAGMGATGKIVLSYNEQPIFSTYGGEVGGMPLVYGFQNLDENNDLELEDLGEYNGKSILQINDTTPPTWNGVIIGKVVGN